MPPENTRRLGLLCFLLANLVSAFALTTIHVPADKPTIQAAIAAAVSGDTVLVAPGTYVENVDFVGKNITIISEQGAAATIIDGNNVTSAVSFHTSETSAAVLNGFTLRNAAGPGVRVSNASPKILNNVITGSSGCSGGSGIEVYFGAPLIQGNTIQNNGVAGCISNGGGIAIGGIVTPPAQIIGNVIKNNRANSGGGISMWSAGAVVIKNNEISGNTAQQGGAFYFVNESNEDIIQNLIANNTATQGAGAYISVPTSTRGIAFVSNTFAENDSASGSAIYLGGFYSQTRMVNNILSGKNGQVALYCDNSYSSAVPTFTNNDTFSSNALAFNAACSAFTSGNGNISSDPKFVAAPAKNFRLQSSSPAIDAGTNTDPALLTQDLDGNTRVEDGNIDGTATVDLGVYEFQGLTTVTTSVPSINFSNQKIGTQSAPQTVTITNTGAKPLQLGLSTSPEFLQTNNCAPQGVAPGSTCDVSVVFAPIAPGAHNTQVLTIVANTANSPITINLSGFATAPVVQLQPVSLTFVTRDLFTTSAAQTITVTNAGDADLIVGAVTATGDFARTSDCAIVVPSASCSISVTFTPVVRGARAGAISIASDAIGSPHMAPLSGTATGAAAVFTPNRLLFPNQRTGTLGFSKQMVLSNPGESALNISDIAITGDFQGTNDCPSSLAPTQQCTFTLAFAPTLAGLRTGAVVITDNAAGSPQFLALSGLGTSPVAVVLGGAPRFGSFVVGTSSAPVSTLIQNAGTDLLTIASVSIDGDYSQSNGCNMPLPPGYVCSISTTFSPTGAGLRNGTLTIVHDAPGSPYQLSVTGTGLATYPVPTLSSISPGGFKVGSNGATVNIIGSGFFPATTVRWNDSPRDTRYVSATFLSVTLTADDLAGIGEGKITVFNPSPGGGTSNSIIAPIYTTVVVSARDMVFDPFRRLFWVTVTAGSPTNANSVVSIDPQTGAFGQPIALGGEGRKLAMSDDGQFLYVGLDGTYSIRRLNLNTNSSDLLFSLGADSFYGGYAAEDMQVIPGNPHALVVSRANWNVSPANAGVAIYDDGVMRSQSISRNQGSSADSIRISRDGTQLWASETGSSGASFSRFTINSLGITPKDSTFQLAGGIIETDGTYVYKFNGQVLNPSTLTVVGQFALGTTFGNSIRPDPGSGRVYFLNAGSQSSIIFAGNRSDFSLSGSLQVPEGVLFAGSNLSRWGADGLAFRIYSGSSNLGGYSSSDKVVLLRSASLTNPSTGNNPTPAIATLSPAVKIVGDGNFILTVSGSNFVPGARVQWNGADRETSFQSASTVTAAIPATDIVRGPVSVTVVNPTPSGGTSAPKSMAINGSSLTFSPASVSVPATSYRRSSTPIPVTVHNNTAAPISINNISSTGDFSQTNNCGTTLAANGNCTVNISFAANSIGSQTGTVTVNTNTNDSPGTIAVTGLGTDFTIALARPARSTRTATNAVIIGQSARYDVVVSGTTAPQDPVTFECSGAPVGTSCVVEPGSTVLTGGDVTVSVILNTAGLNSNNTKRAKPAGPFTLQVTAKSGGISHSANIQGVLMLRSMRLRR